MLFTPTFFGFFDFSQAHVFSFHDQFSGFFRFFHGYKFLHHGHFFENFHGRDFHFTGTILIIFHGLDAFFHVHYIVIELLEGDFEIKLQTSVSVGGFSLFGFCVLISSHIF